MNALNDNHLQIYESVNENNFLIYDIRDEMKTSSLWNAVIK